MESSLDLKPVAEPLDFSTFFEREYDRLAKACLLLTGSPSEAEDLAQEALARVLERWDDIANMESPTGYLYRTAMNLNRKRLRRLAVRIRIALLGSPNRDEVEAAGDRIDALRAVGSLSQTLREAVVLVDWLGNTTEEAAQLLGVRPSTIRVRLHRGRVMLRERLGGNDA